MKNLIAWIFLGLMSGAIAKAFYPGRQGGGIIATLILGVVGAFAGGTIMTLITERKFDLNAPNLSVPGIIVSVLGAMLVIFIWGLVTRKSAS
jgi:uncharacterized membrane protein YeaQ/YmgE (transglycosylase-associated protein family)